MKLTSNIHLLHFIQSFGNYGGGIIENLICGLKINTPLNKKQKKSFNGRSLMQQTTILKQSLNRPLHILFKNQQF